MLQRSKLKHPNISTSRQIPSRLLKQNNSSESLPHKLPNRLISKRTLFQIPIQKENHSITVISTFIDQSFKETVQNNMQQLDQIKRTYNNICEDRRKYVDIIDWLKHTLSETGNKINDITNASELRNIYSTAILQLIKDFRSQNTQKSKLLQLSWQAVMSICYLEVKSYEDRLKNIQSQIEKKYKSYREQHDIEVNQYRNTILRNSSDLAQKQRFFYQVVTDNRILRNRQRKLTNRLKHELESNSYLKQENLMFYKQNQKMKMVLDSQDLNTKYKNLQQKFDTLQKEFQNQKKKITKCNIIKQIDQDSLRNKLGIKQQVDQIVRRVDVDDLLELEIVETPKVEQLARLYYTAGVQTQILNHDRSTNTPPLYYGKKAVAIQCSMNKANNFQFYKCDDICAGIAVDNLGGELLTAYRQKNQKLKGDIKVRQQLQIKMDSQRKNLLNFSIQKKASKKLPSNKDIIRNKSRKPTFNMKQIPVFDSNRPFDSLIPNINQELNKSRTQISFNQKQSQNDFDREDDSLIKRRHIKKSKIVSKLLMSRNSSSSRNQNQRQPRRSGIKKMSNIMDDLKQKGIRIKVSRTGSNIIEKINDKQTQKQRQRDTDSIVEASIQTGQNYSQIQNRTLKGLQHKNSMSDYAKDNSLHYYDNKLGQFQQILVGQNILSPKSYSIILTNTNSKVNNNAQKQSQIQLQTLLHKKSMTSERSYQSSDKSNIIKNQKQFFSRQLSPRQANNNFGLEYDVPITIRVSGTQGKKRISNVIKIDQRQSQNEIFSDSNFSHYNNKQNINSRTSALNQQHRESKRCSKFSLANIEKLKLQLEKNSEINSFQKSPNQINQVKTNSVFYRSQYSPRDDTPYSFQVTQTLLVRILKKITQEILKHRENIINQNTTFEEFLYSRVDRQYGIGTLSFDIRDKFKQSIKNYYGENPQKKAFKILLQGQNIENSVEYKKYIFLIYVLSIQFCTLYNQTQQFIELLAGFVKDILEQFCTMDIVNMFIKNIIVSDKMTDGNQLFLKLNELIQEQTACPQFVESINQLCPILKSTSSLDLKQIHELFSLIQPNLLILMSKLKQISQFCIKGQTNIPVFKLILILKRIRWYEALNFQQTLKIKYLDRFQVQNTKDVSIQVKKLSKLMPSNQFALKLSLIITKQNKDNFMLIYQIVKLQYVQYVSQKGLNDLIGKHLIGASEVLVQLGKKVIFRK